MRFAVSEKFPWTNSNNWSPLVQVIVSTFSLAIGSAGLGIANKFNKTLYGVGWFFLCAGIVLWKILPSSFNAVAFEVALKAFDNSIQFPAECKVRWCVWQVDGRREELVQAMDYRGAGKNGKGTRKHISVGVEGQAYRLEASQVVVLRNNQCSNPEDFCKLIIKEFGYTKEKAQKLPSDIRIFLGVPIFSDGDKDNIVGIFYLDAHQSEVFEDGDIVSRIERFVPTFSSLLLQEGQKGK